MILCFSAFISMATQFVLQVVMGAKTTSVHEQVMENTKRLTFRAQQIALQLEKMKLDKKVCIINSYVIWFCEEYRDFQSYVDSCRGYRTHEIIFRLIVNTIHSLNGISSELFLVFFLKWNFKPKFPNFRALGRLNYHNINSVGSNLWSNDCIFMFRGVFRCLFKLYESPDMTRPYNLLFVLILD